SVADEILRHDDRYAFFAVIGLVKLTAERTGLNSTISDAERHQRPPFPAFRHAVNSAGVLVAREAEADEPLAVELPPCLLQQRHPPPVVLDQVVVGGENLANAALIPDVPRNADFTLLDAPR